MLDVSAAFLIAETGAVAEDGAMCFFIFMFDESFTRDALMPRGHFLLSVVTKESKNTLLDKESRSPFAEVLSLCFIRQKDIFNH